MKNILDRFRGRKIDIENPEMLSEELIGRIENWTDSEDTLMTKIGELVIRGADIRYLSLRYDRTPIFAAARKGYSKIVRGFLEEGVDVNAAPGARKGTTLVEIAVEKIDVKMLEVLQQHGANFNSDEFSEPLLVRALESQFYEYQSSQDAKKEEIENAVAEMVGKLVQYGASADAADRNRIIFMNCASTKNYAKKAIETAIENMEKYHPEEAITLKNQAMIFGILNNGDLLRYALEKGADPKIWLETTTIFTAVARSENSSVNNAKMIKFLMEKGADIDVTNINPTQKVLQMVQDDVEAINNITICTILMQDKNQENWNSLQSQLQASPNVRAGLSLMNQDLLLTLLPDELLRTTIQAEILHSPSRDNRISKMRDVREKLIERFTEEQKPNPEVLANIEMAQRVLDLEMVMGSSTYEEAKTKFNNLPDYSPAREEKIKNFIELKKRLITNFIKAGEDDVESLANIVMVDLVLDRQKLQAIGRQHSSNSFTEALERENTLNVGIASRIMRVLNEPLLSSNIASFAESNSELSEKQNLAVSGVLQDFLNPRLQNLGR